MISALDSGLRGLGSSTGGINMLHSWAGRLNLTGPLSTLKFKWVLANYQGSLMKCWGAVIVMDKHPIQGGSCNTPSCLMLRKLG